MKRLFTFGCSFTNYRWSTWADCLAPEFDYFQNWGQSGAGNQFIFNSVMECDQRYNFGTNDTIIVCWTDVMREDWYTVRWQTHGNMVNNKIYNKEYIAQATERGELIKDLAYIKATKTLLESKSDVNWKFISMCDITHNNLWDDDPISATDVTELYNNVIDAIMPSYKTVLRPLGWGGPYPGWCEQNRNGDPHPNPSEHLQYLDTILPGWVTKQETRVKIDEETNLLKENKYKLENHKPRRSGLSTVTRL
jgi:hypothetical protein